MAVPSVLCGDKPPPCETNTADTHCHYSDWRAQGRTYDDETSSKQFKVLPNLAVAQVFGVDNPILSYVTTDLNTGTPIVVNVTNSVSGFAPGYVARTVSNGVVNNYGEGLALTQSPLLFSPELNYLLDQYVWRSQTNQAVKRCGCER